MAEMARALGNTEDAEKYESLFTNIKNAFIKNYIVVDSETGKLTLLSGTRAGATGEDNAQTSLLWALKLELYENDNH